MANYFSLQDGILTNSSTYGYSLSGAEIMSNTTGTMLASSNYYSTSFNSDGSTLSAIGLHLSSRAASPTGTVNLTLNRIASAGVFLDSSTNNSSISTIGSSYQNAYTPFSPNGWSAYYSSNTSYLETNLNLFSFATVNFTIECWIFIPVINRNISLYNTIFVKNNGIAGNSNYTFHSYLCTNGTKTLFVMNGVDSTNTARLAINTVELSSNVWTHLAVVRNGTTISTYVNGVSAGAITNSALATLNNPVGGGFKIGSLASGNTSWAFSDGYISNFRILTGVAAYTTNTFTPSTSPLTNIAGTALLAYQNHNFRDNSNNNFTLTSNGTPVVMKDTSPFTPVSVNPNLYGASALIPLSSGLVIPSTTYTKLLTNPFTLEFWFNSYTSTLPYKTIFSNQNSNGTGLSILLNNNITSIANANVTGTLTVSSLSPPVTPPVSSYNGTTYSNYYSIPKAVADATGDWTIEGWFYFTSNNTTQALLQYTKAVGDTGGIALSFRNTNVIGIYASSTGSSWDVQLNLNTGLTIPTLNAWYHIAFVKSGNTYTPYLNGVAGTGFTNAFTIYDNGTNSWYIGSNVSYGSGSEYFRGYISEIRLTKRAVYTGNFSAPTAALEVQNTNTKQLLYINNGAFQYKYYNASANDGGISIYSGGTLIHTASAKNYNYGWHHLALSRDSNGSRLYIDGILEGSQNASMASVNLDGTAPNSWYFAKNSLSSYDANRLYYNYYNGYLSNVRCVTGTALYTANFTPSTAPLTNVSGTTLLLNTNNIGLISSISETYAISSFTSYDGSNNLVSQYPQNWQILKLTNPLSSNNREIINYSLSTSNPSQLSLISAPVTAIDSTGITTPYFNGSPILTSFKPYSNFDDSFYFNGSSDYIFIPANQNFNLDRDFTIEFWMNSITYSLDGSAQRELFTFGDYNFSGNLHVYLNNTGTFAGGIQMYYPNATVLTTSAVVADGAWHHVALVRYNNLLNIYIDGVASNTIAPSGGYYNNVNYDSGVTYGLTIAAYRSGVGKYKGYINNFRIVNGTAVYTTSSFVPPTTQLSVIPNTVLLMKGGAKYDQAFILNASSTPTSADNIHIGSALKGLNSESRTITASTSTFNNLYIHNQGALTFPATSSVTLTLNGSAGLQITSDGTLNIGTSSSVIPLSTTHTIVLSNTQIDVHNGGNLNVYGYPKLATTNLVDDTNSGARTFTTVDNVSSDWSVGDTITFKPNLTYRTGFDTLALSSFTGSNVFTTTSASTYTHNGSATYGYIAGVYNLSRNIIIKGLNSTARASIRTIDAAKASVNYAQLSNFGINSANKTGFVFGNNSNGSNVLSGIVIASDNTSTVNNIAPLTGRTFQNTTISKSIINKSNVIAVSSLSVVNVTITNNYILSSGSIGLQMNNLSGSINMLNNTTVGSLSYGTYIANNSLSGTYGSNNVNSTAQGMYISGTNTGSIFGGGFNSAKEGVYVDASTGTLSGTIFQNITANNNTSVGFKVSGNNLNYLTPVPLNINGLIANSNYDAGFEGYNISGNLSSIAASNPNSSNNIRASIGNLATTFDGLTSSVDNDIIQSPFITSSASVSAVSAVSPFADNSDGSISIPTTGNSYYTLPLVYIPSTSDYTIEFFMKMTGTAGQNFEIFKISGSASTGWGSTNCVDILNYSGNLAFQMGTQSNTTVTASPFNVWKHIALVRRSGICLVFINGVSAVNLGTDTSVVSGIIGLAQPDSSGFTNGFFTGSFSNIIISNSALYTTNNFTVPSATKTVLNKNVHQYILQYPYTYLTLKNKNLYTNMSITSAYNYNQVVINNALLSSTSVSGVALGISNVNKLEEFRLENSTLSAITPLQITSSRSKIEGSYLFHNCNSDVYGLSTIALTGYQSDTFLESGMAVMRENGLSGNHYKVNAAGKVSYDKVNVRTLENYASEKLEPASSSIKLRSASKYIPVKESTSLIISVYVYKSVGYTGDAPRLILKSNGALGYNDTILDTSTSANGEWELLSGTVPDSLTFGTFEVYVDCGGSVGCGSINIDDWDFS